jgi:hypothetical protein
MEKRMSRGEILFPALIAAAAAALLLLGYFYYEYSWVVLMFPLAAGLVLCALCISEMITVLGNRAETQPAMPADEAPLISYASIGWMFALAPFLYAFGFVFGAGAYLLVCLRANGFSWRLSGAIAAAALVVTWGLFIKIFGLQLPIAPLWYA